MNKFIEIGIITKPHGIKGLIKVKPLTFGNYDFLSCKQLFIENKDYKVEEITQNNKEFILKLSNINSILDANLLKNKSVCVNREDVKIDGYFCADLIGMQVLVENKIVGKIDDIQNFGASDVVYVIGKKPFTFANIGGIIDNVDYNKNIVSLNKIALDEVICYED